MPEPDSTAVRTALWRARHLEVDAPPHVVVDELGLKLAAPDPAWRDRPDMHPEWTKSFRASIVGRARFVEDLVEKEAAGGLAQYVILGAGLDTFVQRRPALAAKLHVFEIDQPGPQAWKREQLEALGYGVPAGLHLVPVNFEAGERWRDKLFAAGFDRGHCAVVSSLGVSMYLTREANAATLREVAELAPGTTLVISFLCPLELADAAARPGLERAAQGAAASGTPFVSYFRPDEMVTLAREAGFKTAQHVSAEDLTARYFAGRTDGLAPPRNAEELVVAST